MSAPSKPGWYSGSFGVSAASEDRWPPAEPPVITTYDGSPPYSSTWSLTQAIALFTSMIWAGNGSRGASR